MAELANPIIALIPAYNAAHLVAPVIEEARRHLPVVVVDDGSTDDTAAVAEAAGARVIRQVPNQGKGAALKNGFRTLLAEGVEAVVTLDADGQHDPGEIPKLLAAWRRDRPEMVVGARDYDEMPFVRRLSNKVGRRSIEWALGAEVADNQSGYRVIGRRLMQTMLDSGESGFEFEVWMIVLSVRNGWKMSWVPIRTIYGDQGSHIKPLEHVKGYFRTISAIRTERRSWTAATRS
ncbi:MAG TPA: glycosyltransferase family 2 protein [Longimicrobiales bacterium]